MIVHQEERVETILVIPEGTTPVPDLAATFRWSEPGKGGQRYALESGARLRDGDEFTIELHASTPMNVYIIHFDSHGQVQDLMLAGGAGNQMQAGERRKLPRDRPDGMPRHYYLDKNTGIETIHFIVAARPLVDLMARYRQGRLRRTDIDRIEHKGILVAPGKPEHQAAGKRDSGTMFACPIEREFCAQTFIIHHEARI
ncbi:MAG: DUF4384 domain-containing protein [Gammaproteobacteria bacterium]|nr:DUF4384 domain-containing protein [Gammaproteobacteria bacterium]